MASSVECDVDATYYPHLLLIPAGIIITILAFLRRRKNFKKHIWGGRPGVVVPVDFLGMDHNRLTVMSVFGSATGSIFVLVSQSISGYSNFWEKAFLIIGTAIEVALIYYPYFACLTSYHKKIGASMGLPYAFVVLIVNMTKLFQKCKGYTKHDYVVATLINIPIIICHLFILGKFILVLYKETKESGLCSVNLFSNEDERLYAQPKLVRPWLRDYVEDVIAYEPKPSPQYSVIEMYLRKMYNPEKNFKFSTQTLSVVMICSILLYAFSLNLLYLGSFILDQVEKTETRSAKLRLFGVNSLKFARGLSGSLIAATFLTVILCGISLLRFMENHKNNMLKMFKGDKSFIPECFRASQFMVGRGLRYHSFQIGYFVWGYFLVLLLCFVIVFCFFAFVSYALVRDLVVDFILSGAGVIAGVAFLTRLILPILAMTLFRDSDYSKDVISINNRNVYLVFSYFWFFIGLPMGLFSAVWRMLKVLVIGLGMLPRIDHSLLPDGFQRLDPGYKAYIGYLYVQAAHRNPILRVFSQILCDETRLDTAQKWKCSAKARSRWFLACTLIRNPQLASKRKSYIQALRQVKYANHGDVKIEIPPSGNNNSGSM